MRTKSSMYNFIIKFTSSLTIGALGIIVNNLILTNFGSDVNGLWGTIAQLLNLLTIFEGGLTLSANVSLYKPYLENDISKINDILTATRKMYLKIGSVITFLAVMLSFISPFIIESDVDRKVIVVLFLIATSNLTIQFFFTTRYNILFSTGQKEYINSSVTLVFNVLSQVISVLTILQGWSLISVKLLAVVIPLLRMPIIIKLHHRIFKGVHFKSSTPNFDSLKAVKDIVALQFASLIFGSTDLIVISTLLNTKFASVYSVYNMVYSFIRTFLSAMIMAPFNAFGQLYASGKIEQLIKSYNIFIFITVTIINIFITSVNIVIIPFISLYTRNVTDINYIDRNFAMLFSLICVLASIGDILSLTNSTGHFKEMKRISVFTAITNIVISVLLVPVLGIYGVVVGTILSYLIHFTLQGRIVFNKILHISPISLLVKLSVNALISVILISLSVNYNLSMNNYFDFFGLGIITFIIVSLVIGVLNFIIFNRDAKLAIQHFHSTLLKKKDR